jgi:hypothetical protein
VDVTYKIPGFQGVLDCHRAHFSHLEDKQGWFEVASDPLAGPERITGKVLEKPFGFMGEAIHWGLLVVG